MVKKNINFNEKLIKTENSDEIEAELLNNYNQLNEKCDSIINKIKTRKAKKKNAA